MYLIYQIISFLIYPFLKLLLIIRVAKGKEDRLRFKEKLGFYDVKRPAGKLIWFHAASIGEFNAILPIIKSISSHNILVTTVTITAANIAKNNLPANAIHQFMPLDSIIIVKRFLNFWQPSLVIWTESEFWPNMLTLCKAQKLLINARLSKKSFSKWRLSPKFAKFILDKFSLILAQSIETKEFLEKLGATSVEYLGNLKFLAANFNFDSSELEKLKLKLKGRVILMAASTHEGEELLIEKVHSNLKQKYPELLTIIAPRHPNRLEAVQVTLKEHKFVIRSSGEEISDSTEILLVDTIGEFGLFYRLSHIVCVGGSWKKIAHSFIEPAKLGNLIIFGPNMSNSREVADEFLSKNAAIFADNEKEIEQIIESYIKNPQKFQTITDNAEVIVDKMSQVKDKILEKIRPFIDKL
jgi:3-deoxy-D-manno-octulosonic-acid transferase